jgi:hypothetical protein
MGGDHKPNVTGFDMRKFLAATGNQRYDPWERKCVTLLPSRSPLYLPTPSHTPKQGSRDL